MLRKYVGYLSARKELVLALSCDFLEGSCGRKEL
jgi:hypothetical protein